ncbi:hypothetical protein AB0B89_34355 [Sphaerisporangium sp. NPDC049002]|uniref:hypothetical protein n=1 Tax=Sphaerisporangium sp. NPDC049002 TaxID=3155392 RepID=UPI0033D2847A
MADKSWNTDGPSVADDGEIAAPAFGPPPGDLAEVGQDDVSREFVARDVGPRWDEGHHFGVVDALSRLIGQLMEVLQCGQAQFQSGRGQTQLE